ncbi:YraN family protein [Candidatus Roizmanbacteria bacterium]|nr:YraN family protein [Candidatus Roizmanbacteria bacterium]
MGLYKKIFGNSGETIASTYLINHSFEIIQKNFRSKFGEIDIIAEKNNCIYFIEVKTRSNLYKGMPYEAVNNHKIDRMYKTAYYFLMRNNYKDYRYSIGVISIVKNEKETNIQFYENVTQ